MSAHNSKHTHYSKHRSRFGLFGLPMPCHTGCLVLEEQHTHAKHRHASVDSKQAAHDAQAECTRTLICAAAVIRISRKRGIPSVTLASPRPAMWKVLSVICTPAHQHTNAQAAVVLPTGRPSTGNKKPAGQTHGSLANKAQHAAYACLPRQPHLCGGLSHGLCRQHAHSLPRCCQRTHELELLQPPEVCRTTGRSVAHSTVNPHTL